MPKLNQIVAIEKGVKSRVYGSITEMNKLSKKPDLFNGFARSYRPKTEADEKYPTEHKAVQQRADANLRKAANLMIEAFDVTATKDFANCEAKADIVVGDVTLAEGVPTSHLLWLEKQLNDIHTFIRDLPTLDEADEWVRDATSGLYKTAATEKQRTKKDARAIVLYDATDKHPAQTQLISEDRVVGYWDEVKHSGALPGPRKDELLARVDELLKAVKFAREQANNSDAPPVNIGERIFDYLLA